MTSEAFSSSTTTVRTKKSVRIRDALPADELLQGNDDRVRLALEAEPGPRFFDEGLRQVEGGPHTNTSSSHALRCQMDSFACT